jgi:transcriptional regulator with PAS, ATPase and Fis domain
MSVTQRPKAGATTETTRRSSGSPAADDRFALLVSCASGVYVVPLAGREAYVIGRTPECDVVIADGSVSRQHARLVLGGSMTLEDLGTTNGTSVHGQALRPREPVPVSIGSVFELGSATCVLQRARAAGAQLAAGSIPPHPSGFHTASIGGPIVCDATMRNLYALLDLVAPSPLAVLILGETGVGKEMYAEALHKQSPRAAGKFLQLNCAALPESILEGELFGYERGAFTGAVHAKEGLFESADGGTVFLDEVGELPMATQAKLLRVLETGQVMRLGSVTPKTVDVRVVSATNRDLRHAIAENRFRPDLYFRLNGMSVTLPPLRQRKADIRPLANAFAAKCAATMGRPVPMFSDDAIAAFERYGWPGNVRELRNVVERVLVIGQGSRIDLDMLSHADPEAFGALHVGARMNPPTTPGAFAPMPVPSSQEAFRGLEETGRLRAMDLPHAQTPEPSGLRGELQSFERQRILDALAKCAGNQTQAAKALGISRFTLMNRLEAYGIARPRKR